jgi:general secretion pathway protein A
MYAPFFGLSKEPFSIAPDPRFLFMSDMHREALAHLLYGVSGGGGFVLLTGEIGAGKTTVCRAFLDQVPAHCAVAYIFNPKLTVPELLQTICEEFGVEAPGAAGSAPSVKAYVDALNGFLLSAHAAGCHTVLIIDEAQSLAADVLEQLRLLTNLETSERKLLQIVLIGQPELRDLLARPELEQMAQRVIARYHLPALSAAETGQYIQHRLAVAGPTSGRDPFDSRAVARVHALTGGVPRRINLLCDRALLGAYAHGQHRVSADMVDKAAREVFGPPRPGSPGAATGGWGRRGLGLGVAAGVATLALAAAWVWRSELGLGAEASAGAAPGVALAASAVAARPVGSAAADAAASSASAVALAGSAGAASGPAAPAASGASTGAPVDGTEAVLTDAAPVLAAAWRDEAAAWRDLATHWKLALPEGEPCELALSSGLVCHRAGSGLGVLRQVARPALLVLRDTGAAPVYVKLLGVGATGATLAAGDRRWRLPLPELARVWRGEFLTLWRAPPGWRAGPEATDAPATQAWLQQRLAAAGVAESAGPLRERVRTFQVANGLQADGLAGPLTLMLLARTDEPGLLQDR